MEAESFLVSSLDSLKEAVRKHLSSVSEKAEITDLRDTLGRIRMSLNTEAPESSADPTKARLPELVNELVTLLKETDDFGVVQEGLSLLKSLANYHKDGTFVRTFQACQGISLLLDLLKRNWDHGSIWVLLFNLLKLIASHRCSCKLLGREGIVDLFQDELIPRAAAANAIVLKASLEALTYVLKLNVNSAKAADVGLAQTLLTLLGRHSSRKEKNRLKLCKYTVSCLHSISKQEHGLSTLSSRTSLEALYQFCTSCPNTEAYDAVLNKAGSVIIRCASKQLLPITLKGPLSFTLPASDEGIHSAAIYSRESTPLSGTVSESDNDASDGVADEDDDEEAGQEKAHWDRKRVGKQKRRHQHHRERKNSSRIGPRYHEVTNLSLFAPFFHSPSSDDLTTQGEGGGRNESDFRWEILAELSAVLKQPSHYGATSEMNGASRSEKALDFDHLMAVTAKWDRMKIYEHVANRVHHILPFIKLAYPDWVGARGEDDEDQFLHMKDRKVCRSLWLRNLEQAVHPDGKVAGELVYDLDNLLTESSSPQWLNNDDGNLLGKREIGVNHLCFESRFESGNLRKVFKVGPREYDLILNSDVNSSHRQLWFYFQIRNMQASLPYTFNILNFEKQKSLFNQGMKPVMFSVTQALVKQRSTWVRAGTDICYFRNVYRKLTSSSGKNYMTATFSVTFPYSHDVVYMAYHYPYTYSQLLTDICLCKRDKPDLTVKTLCSTLLRNPVPVLQSCVADPAVAKLVFLTGRVHPGESNSSWVMKGSLEAVARSSSNPDHAFVVVPMLNIDGVINGCYRCDVTDEDLNRRWLNPDPVLHPTIYHTKGLIEYACKVLRNPPSVFCDYHGHSRHMNIFLYGCSAAHTWNPADAYLPQDLDSILELVHSMHDNCQAFCKDYCSFVVEEERESTARVALWRNLGIQRSYTLEASLAGAERGDHQGKHLTTQDYEAAGHAFVSAVMNLKR